MLPAEATENFRRWVQEQLDERGLSMREASLGSGLSDSRLGQILRGEKPGIDAIIKLADYFDIPREKAFYIAGYLKHDPTLRIDVPPELLNFMRRLMQMSKKERQFFVSKVKPVLELVLSQTENQK